MGSALERIHPSGLVLHDGRRGDDFASVASF